MSQCYNIHNTHSSREVPPPPPPPLSGTSVQRLTKATISCCSVCLMIAAHAGYVFSTMRWEHGAHGSISSDSVEDLGVTVLVDTRYAAGAGWRLPMTVIAPRTVGDGETLLANTTLSIGAASAVDVTLRFFA
eukprot:COSAG01_NODE_38333_length_491_cov_0.670918_1_plen_131_part_10